MTTRVRKYILLVILMFVLVGCTKPINKDPIISQEVVGNSLVISQEADNGENSPIESTQPSSEVIKPQTDEHKPSPPEILSNPKYTALEEALKNKLGSQSGDWAVSVIGLKEQGVIEYQSQQQMKAASLIKLFVAGAYLEFMNGAMPTDYEEGLLEKMLSESDNDSTNVLIANLGEGDFEQGKIIVNEWMTSYGFEQTRLERALGDLSQPDQENYTSCQDVSRFLVIVYSDSFSHQGIGTFIQDKLLKQSRRNKIPSNLAKDVMVANKTGELSGVEHDAALILTDNPYVLVIMSQNLNGNGQGIETIGQIAQEVYQTLSN